MNAKTIVVVVLVLAGAAAGGWFWLQKGKPGGGGNGETNSSGGGGGGAVQVAPHPIPDPGASAIDGVYGKKLFEGSCVPCHGYDGRGAGPAAFYVWRRPADLTDGVYFTTRSDDDLLAVIGEGGKRHKRSSLMPDWITFYNTYERRDIVAFMRTLAPDPNAWLPGAKRVRVQSVLTPATVAALSPKLAPEAPFDPKRDHTVDFVRVLDGSDKVLGHVAFDGFTIDGQWALVCVAVGADGKIAKAGTHHVLTYGQGQDFSGFFAQFTGMDEAGVTKAAKPAPGAEAASATLAAVVRKTWLRLMAGIQQDAEDLKLQDSPPAPANPGEELYRKACAECHGVFGNAKGKGIKAIEPTPRNFRDGRYMNQPEITRDYVLKVIRKGGAYMNLSSAVPGYEKSLEKDEIEKIADFVLSLSIPPRK